MYTPNDYKMESTVDILQMKSEVVTMVNVKTAVFGNVMVYLGR